MTALSCDVYAGAVEKNFTPVLKVFLYINQMSQISGASPPSKEAEGV
jgi:hypothetical protein